MEKTFSADGTRNHFTLLPRLSSLKTAIKFATAAVCLLLSRLAVLIIWSCWFKKLRRKVFMMIMGVFDCDYVTKLRAATNNGDGALRSDFWVCVIPKPVVLQCNISKKLNSSKLS